jgi:hypothetical protein
MPIVVIIEHDKYSLGCSDFIKYFCEKRIAEKIPTRAKGKAIPI